MNRTVACCSNIPTRPALGIAAVGACRAGSRRALQPRSATEGDAQPCCSSSAAASHAAASRHAPKAIDAHRVSRRASHALVPLLAAALVLPATAHADGDAPGSIVAPQYDINTSVTARVYLDIGLCETAYKKDRAIGEAAPNV